MKEIKLTIPSPWPQPISVEQVQPYSPIVAVYNGHLYKLSAIESNFQFCFLGDISSNIYGSDGPFKTIRSAIERALQDGRTKVFQFENLREFLKFAATHYNIK